MPLTRLDRSAFGGIKEMLALALPMVVSHGAETAMTFTDRLFLSRLGSAQMSAAMAGGLTSFTLMTFFIGLTGYAAAIVAQYFGANQPQRCVRTTTQALIIALLAYPVILSLRPLALGWFDVSGIAPEQLGPQKIYFNLLLTAVIIGLLRNVLASFFIGIGKTRIVMVAALLAMISNVGLNYVLIFGRWGFPALGIRGAAYGTIIGSLIGLTVVLAAYMGRANRQAFPVMASFRFDGEIMLKLFRYGSPAGAEMFLNLMAFTGMVVIFHAQGLATAAAATIMFNWDMVSFVPLIGIEIGVTSLVGRYMGQGNPETAHRVTRSGLKLGWWYSGLILILFVFFPETLVAIFQPQGPSDIFHQAAPVAVFMIRLAAVYVLVEAILIVHIGALRGAGDTFWAMAISVTLHWFLVAILYLMLQVWGLSAQAGWTALVLTFFVFSFLVVWRYRTGRWRQIRLVQPEPVPTTVPTDEFHEPADL